MSAPSGSYYMASANPHASHPRLGGEQRADVCVIGAGMTGLTAALELAGRGYTVAVVEPATSRGGRRAAAADKSSAASTRIRQNWPP